MDLKGKMKRKALKIVYKLSERSRQGNFLLALVLHLYSYDVTLSMDLKVFLDRREILYRRRHELI